MTKFYRNSIVLSIFLLILIAALQVHAQTDRRLRLARTFDRAGDYPSALELYLQLYEEGKESPEIISGITRNYKRLQKYDALIAFLQRLIKKHPGRYQYKIELAGAYYLADRKQEAFDLWRSVYQTPPRTAVKYRQVAQALTDLRLFDRAIELYRQAVRQFPDQPTLYRDLATLYRARLNYEQAALSYLDYLLRSPRQSRYIRSQLLSMAKDQEVTGRIISAVEPVVREHESNEALRQILADLYLRAKKYGRAFDIYADLNKQNPKGNYLFRFAGQAEANQAFEYAVRAYEQLLQTAPLNRKQTLEFYLAKTLFRFGGYLAGKQKAKEGDRQVKRALEILSRISQPALRYQALELTGDIYLHYYGDLDRAAENYSGALKLKPDRRLADRLHMKLANVYLRKNQLNQCAGQLKQVRPGRMRQLAQMYLADLAFYQGQFKRAEEAYREILRNSAPEDTLYNNVLQQLTLLENFGKDSTALAQFSHARLLEAQQKYSEAAKEYQALFVRRTELNDLAAEKAVRLYMKLRKWPQAEALLRQWIQSAPDAANIDLATFWLARVLQEQGKLKEALTFYQKILIVYPDSFYTDQARRFARLLNEQLESEQNEH